MVAWLYSVCEREMLMATITFDTFENVKRLKAVGFTEEQAIEQTKIISELVENRLATKQDLKELEISLKNDLDLKISATKVELIKWVAGMLIVQAAAIAALVKLL